MTDIELPALDGRTALGFLAACGVVRLAEQEMGRRAALAWSADTGSAVVRIEHCASLDDVVSLLAECARGFADGQLLPGGPTGFPPGGGGKDPMRMEICVFRCRVEDWKEQYGASFIERWIPAMVTDLAEKEGSVQISLFAAPSGQQKFNTLFAGDLNEVRKAPEERLTEALRSWRRVDGRSGEYLDHRVIRSASDTTAGSSLEAGVPGATWLALMALPLFPVSGDGRQRGGAGWRRLRGREALVWPLWEPFLDSAAIAVAVGHPVIDVQLDEDQLRWTRPEARDLASRLGFFSLFAARRGRIEGRNFEGVLIPLSVAPE
jgi:CRISPR-associated endonuclease/helicase Cas3